MIAKLLQKIKNKTAQHYWPPSFARYNLARLHAPTVSQRTSCTGRQETSFAVVEIGESETETTSGPSAGRPTPTGQHLQQ